MKNYKKIVFAVTLIFFALIIIPFLVPTQSYLRQAEQIASDKLGVPVTISDGHWRFLPSPRLIVNDIVIGDDQEVMVDEIVIVPLLNSLFSDTKQLDLKVIKPVIKQSVVAIISALTAKDNEQSDMSMVHVNHIKINHMQFISPKMQLPILNAEIVLTKLNTLDFAQIQSLDGNLKADITPNADAHLVKLSVSRWTLPTTMPLLIDRAMLEMHLKGNQLIVPNINATLYGGKLTGNAELTWQTLKNITHWKTKGSLNLTNLSVKEPSKMLNKHIYLSGRLFSDGRFSASAKELGQLAKNLQANFKFKIHNGVLHGLDLVKVASLLVKQSQNGGQTQFDAFSGLLNVSGKQYHLRNLNISSGLLLATGQVKIKPNKQLNGLIAAEIKHSVSLVAIPLDVSGTVSKPVILPSKGALVGAAAGTAILGPGVGTSIGIKAAGALDSVKEFFGGDK